MNAIFTEPEKFIRDLGRISAALDPSLKIDSFLFDLDRVHRDAEAVREPVHPVPDHDHSELASLFDEIRAGAIKKLGGSTWLDKLPKNDPLRCRVGLLGTLDLGLRETAHTRTLAWLLDPREDHGFGDTLLRAFLKQIFALDSDPQLTDDVRINSELRSGENRDRLDISLSGRWTLPRKKVESWLVIVEAKVEADEGEEQCARYENQFHEQIASSDNHALVFLTPDGRAPTTGSNGGGPDWITLSFIKLMALFRQRLPELSEQPEFGFLRHYMTGVLKDLYQLNCGRITETDDIYRISEYLSLEITGGE